MTLLMLRGGDGRYYYLKPDIAEAPSWGPKVEWLADGQPVELFNASNPNTPALWLASTDEVAEFTARWSARPTRIGWKLTDPSIATDKLPAEPTSEQFDELPESLRESGLYEGVYAPGEQFERRFVAADWTRYDGEPAPADGLVWTASLPHSLGGHPELAHLFPGHLGGFRVAAIARLKRYPHLKYVFDKVSILEVTVELQYDVPRTRWRPVYLRSGRKSSKREQVTEKYTKQMTLPIGDRITGGNRAAAVVEWDRRMAELDGFATETAQVRACSHCDGRGVVVGADS